jgi:hypothetical protein
MAARIVHAAMSPSAAAESARPPSGVRWSPRSARMRASTGKAVTLIAAPTKSAKGVKRKPGGALGPNRKSDSTAPKAKGTTMLTWPIRGGLRARAGPVSRSRPTRNM